MIIAAYIMAIALQSANAVVLLRASGGNRHQPLTMFHWCFVDHQTALTIKRLYIEYIYIFLYLNYINNFYSII